MNFGIIIPFLYNTPLFRSAVNSLADFPGPIVLVEHKDIENKGLEQILARPNITLLKNVGKSGADDALELGIAFLASRKIDFTFYCHSDLVVSPEWLEEFLPTFYSHPEIGQWNFRHDHFYFRDQNALQAIQTNEFNYEELSSFCNGFGINNHKSRTDTSNLEFSVDFWGSHRTGRTAPLTGFYTQSALEVINEKPRNTWALLDVALSRYTSQHLKWKIYYNTRQPALHISATGHDGFGADTGTFARATSAFIEQDNDIFRKHYGFMPDDYLNFEYQEIFGNYKSELTEAANSGQLEEYNYLLEIIKDKFS